MEKAIVEAFSAHRDPARAEGMSAYMKHRFPFMGISSPERRRLAQVALAGLPPPTDDDLLEFARACWERPEREYQYAAIDQLRKATKRLRRGVPDRTALDDRHQALVGLMRSPVRHGGGRDRQAVPRVGPR